jgi:hypothetical protein
MDVQAAKLELMKLLLDTQKEQVLEQIQEIFDNATNEPDAEPIEKTLSSEQLLELDDRLNNYELGEMDFKTWEDTKESILARANNGL